MKKSKPLETLSAEQLEAVTGGGRWFKIPRRPGPNRPRPSKRPN